VTEAILSCLVRLGVRALPYVSIRPAIPGGVSHVTAEHPYSRRTRPRALAGEDAPLEFTPPYAAPEVIAAFEAGATSLVADAAADVWALGLTAFEVFTGERVFPPGIPLPEIYDAISGRRPLPWEAQGGDKLALVGRLRGFRRHVLACLERDPAHRPTAAAVLMAWRHVFDAHTSATQAAG
jgi:serine/threonine protein kinase